MIIPDRLYVDCDYFNDEKDSEFTPENGECINCYKYEECYKAYFRQNSCNKINV